MIDDSAGITGPAQAFAIVGNPSPTLPGNLQIVTNQQASFAGTVWAATKKIFNTFSLGAATLSVSKAASGATSEVGHSIGNAVTKTGEAIKSTATSASTGIKWGFFALIIIIGIVLLAQLRRATG